MRAQSPIAHTPSRLVAIVADTTARPPLSTSIPDSADHRGGLDAAGPDHGPRRDELALADDDAVLADLLHRRAEVDLVAARAQLLRGVVAHVDGHLGEDAVLELDDVALRLGRVDLRVEAPPDATDEVLDLAGRLDPAEPRAADDEGELRLALVGIGLEVRSLEHLDDPVAEGERIGQRLHADRVLGDAGDPEGGRLAAEREDQRVVVEPMLVAVAADDDHLLRVEVDPLDVGGDGPARRAAQLRAQRGDAVARLEVAGADLGQERREEAEVLAADEPDLDVIPAAASASRGAARSRRRRSRHRARGRGGARAARTGRSCASPSMIARRSSNRCTGQTASLTRHREAGSPPGRIGRYHGRDMQQPIRELFDQFKQQLPDVDPVETQEWLASLDDVVATGGTDRARFLIYKLLKRARQLQVGLPSLTQTRYINTISPEQEPYFPGDEAMELRIRRMIRWNALAMVLRANTKYEGIGGHLQHLRERRQPLRGRLQPLLQGAGRRHRRRPDLLPGPRGAGHLRPRLPRGPADRGAPRPLPSRGAHARRRALELPAPAAHARLLAVPDGEHGPRADRRGLPGALQPLPERARRGRHDRRPGVGVPRRRRDGRAGVDRRAVAGGPRGPRQPHVRRQLQPPAPRRPGARQREDHPGARGASSAAPAGTSSRSSGPASGTTCWRATSTACSSTR